MRVPIKWLNDYVKVKDIQIKELADLFLGIGFEVEDIINPADAYENIVTGRILNIEKHLNADNLHIIRIDIGKDVPSTIITGANNIAIGNIVPVALPGAVVSGGKKILCTEFRGIMSEGMLCSGKELDIDDNTIEGAEIDGILILPKTTPLGLPIGKALDLDEYIFDISVNSNRPDCNSIFGLAKEIAVKLNRKVKAPSLTYKTVPNSKGITMPNIAIEDYRLCSRYYGNVISDVKIKKSPDWMRKRLIAADIRPINNAVDITNYVLMEIGQPLHAFDYGIIEGDINIRMAGKDNAFIALNDIEYKLDDKMLVIADSKKELAIAGVMGGKNSSISDNTKTVFLETARFAKMNVRYASRAIGLRSASSARFERGVDYNSVDIGRERALNLFDKLKVGKIIDKTVFAEAKPPEKKSISTSFTQINSILGIKIPDKEILRILRSLGFEVDIKNGVRGFKCIVPMHREDVDNFADLSEEVIRFYGYDKIDSTNMESSSLTMGEIPLTISNIKKLKKVLCGAGLYEIINFSFIGINDCEKLNLNENGPVKKQIKIINPLGEDRAYMRTQLVSSMIKTLQFNRSKQNDNVGLFELVKIFVPNEWPLRSLPNEPYSLCVGLSGAQYDFYYLKNIVANILDEFSLSLDIIKGTKTWLHPGMSADIILNGKTIGGFGKLHPTVAKNFEADEDIYILEINIQEIISRPFHAAKVVPLPKYPAVDRDLAVVVRTEITAGEIIAAIKAAAGNCLEKADLFDVYHGGQIEQGYKSMAFSLRFRSIEKTLQDSETQALMTAIITSLEKQCGARLR